MAGAAVKRARAGGGSTSDRLSALPDDLLLRVLSFLPAQQVVRTTVLSKRWADLWRSVPGIILSFLDFRRNSEEDSTAVWERMEDFVDNLLMLHRGPCLDAFQLDALVYGNNHCRHVDRWVRRAIKDDPLVIEVSVPRDSYQLPHLGFSPSRRLTRLHLSGVSLDHSFTVRLHTWWPDLKDLSLRFCRTEFSSIESNKLENLVVVGCNMSTIRAPRLASLSVHLGMPFSLDVNSLVRASIYLYHGEFSPRSGAMLLGSLSNVTSFQLEGFRAMAALDKEFDDVPIFHNLGTLSLGSCFTNFIAGDVHEFKAVGRLLQKSPNLEKLTLRHFKVVPVVEHVNFPRLENLRTLCLLFCDLHANFQILLQCLRNSPNLEKLNIWRCTLPDDSMGGEGKAKSKKTYSKSTNQAHLKLEYAEISYSQDDAGVRELVSFLLDFASPMITVKVTKTGKFLLDWL